MLFYVDVCYCFVLVYVVILCGYLFLWVFSKKGYGCYWTWEIIQHYTETQNKVKEQHFIAVLHFSHSKVFNNEQNSYSKMRVKQTLSCNWMVLFTSANIRYIWGSLSFVVFCGCICCYFFVGFCCCFLWVFVVLCGCYCFFCVGIYCFVSVFVVILLGCCFVVIVGVFVVSWLYYINLLLWNTWIQFHNWNGVIFSPLIFSLITRLQFGLIMVKEVYLSVIHCYNRMKGYVSNRILKTTRRGHFSGRLIKLIFTFII